MYKRQNGGQEFLERLQRVIEENLSNSDFGVSELAREIGMSRSALYARVNLLTRKSVSCYIREIRLAKGLHLLKNSELTISEVAYEVGFGSPSYFIKCFHDYYGFPPGEVKQGENTQINPDAVHTREKKPTSSKSKRKWTYRIVAALAMILIAVSIIAIKPFSSSNDIGTKSIAVLPLKNLNKDQETQILADGIMEDILTRLTHVSMFHIKSSSSTEKYRDSQKTTTEIAKELNVRYVLEGSLLREGEKIRLYIQLIDAKNDNHIWSAHYERDLTGILVFVAEVSRQVADELEAVLTPQEQKDIEKQYTLNTSAYEDYLKGRYFWSRRTPEDLQKSVVYFNRAIQTDPNYSLAYAGLADSYFIMIYWGWYPQREGYIRAKEFALKALEQDNRLAEAHAVLGGIALWFDLNNLETAEHEFRLAIELNPNFAVAHQYYGEYLMIRGRFEEATEQLDKAIQLNPNAPATYAVRARVCYNQGNFEEALKDSKKVSELNGFYQTTRVLNFQIYVRTGKNKQAIDELKALFQIEEPDSDPLILDKIYAAKGITGIIDWLIRWLLTKGSDNNRTGLFNDNGKIAALYMLENKPDSSLIFLKQHFLSTSPTRFSNKYSLDFKPLRDDPRFDALIKKLGLENM
ncbi:helix-turn-helix domain-containing protein [Mangrovibacterium diazotrophicum]|uniref:TolB-like protein n=1 Tax=Mangrovibacterium diazotrophicum TaxID=1261403 RepID=A0A419W6F8_9BACT|nr:helix-turn-helix domain-containing protein [Mangrovibacterium diazotrophicum]RKD91039.1 TolB-like protein [Mangrovibacterium diazotrophicum]